MRFHRTNRGRRNNFLSWLITVFAVVFVGGAAFLLTYLIHEEQPAPADPINAGTDGSSGVDAPVQEARPVDEIEDRMEIEGPFFEPDMPILVNRDNFIPDGHDPDLVPIGDGHYLGRRAAEAWYAMRAAAEGDGISLWAVSAYRSHERQTYNFNNSVQRHIDAGRSPDEAHALTAAYIAIPGTSEHTLGLAVDINSLEVSFENTPEFRWLQENSAEFGFIMRYAREKTEITRINYEPWHFRYVGSNHAAMMLEKDLALEEYLLLMLQGELPR